MKTTISSILSKVLFFVVFGIFLSSSMAFGSSLKGNPQTDPFWNRFYGFIGGDVGYHYLSSDAYLELSKHGYQFDAKALLSYSWTDFTVDVGGGWLYNRSKRSENWGIVLRDNLKMKAGFSRLAGRYRFSPQWEAGLLNHVLFGADTRFQTTSPQESHVHWLAGLEMVYRLCFRFPLQFSAAALTDLTISDRQVFQLLFGVQVGFPFSPSGAKKEVEPQPKPEPTPTVEPSPTPIPTPEPKIVYIPVRSYVLDMKRILFAFDSAKLQPVSERMLDELGDFLIKNYEAWEKLTVEGHTDHVGTAEYNMGLSQRRAEAVTRELIKRGVQASLIDSKGYGFTRPRANKDSKGGPQLNRRVELTFKGITKPDVFDEFFRKINKEY